MVEYWHDFVELLRKRPFDKKLLQTIVGGVLITVGVAGELIVQNRASGVEARLRSVNHLIEAGLIKSAGDAALKAKGFERDIAISNRAAADANERAAKAAKQAGDAGTKAGKANQRAAALEKDAAVQREKATIAERALLELRVRLQDRHLTDAQRATIRAGLATAPKGSSITVLCASGPPEACAFADEFMELFLISGWKAVKVPFIGTEPVGIGILARSAKTPKAIGLQRILKAAGIDAFGNVGLLPDNDREQDVQLFIGFKP